MSFTDTSSTFGVMFKNNGRPPDKAYVGDLYFDATTNCTMVCDRVCEVCGKGHYRALTNDAAYYNQTHGVLCTTESLEHTLEHAHLKFT